MRGSDATSGSLFSYVDLEQRVPAAHPLRTIRTIVNDVLGSLDAEFERLYEGTGRQSIAPERLLRASLLQAFYSVRSERQLMEQIDSTCRSAGSWAGIDDPVHHSTFPRTDRCLTPTSRPVRSRIVPPKSSASCRTPFRRWHWSAGWASLKSFRANDGSDEPPSPGRNGARDFHSEKRANATHESTTDPDAKLFRKGKSQPAKLYFMGHALIENRHGLVVQADATQATGKAERQAALVMIDRHDPGSERPLTLAADKGYDTSDFVADLRQKCVTQHVAQKSKGSAIDGRTTRHEGYATSQRKRKLVEEAFGWGKTIAGLAKVKVRGLPRVRFKFTFAMAAYNLIRMPRLLAAV
jgi:hypothetical protein